MTPLSKSDFMLYLRHPAWLWLKKHNKEILPPVSESLQAVFDEGNLFETYANQLFPNAVKVGFSFEENNYGSMPARTKAVIAQGVKTILQGRLESNNCTCIFDVLQRIGDSETEFDLFEIKSSTEVKEDHIHDLAFQTIVLEGAGLTIRKMFVVYVNKEYRRNGDIDIHAITTQLEVTEQIREHIEETRNNIAKALAIISSPSPPDYSPRHVGLRSMKDWMEIYEALHPQTHAHSIYKLARLNAKLVGLLEDEGIEHIAHIPEGMDLHPKQRAQVVVTKADKRLINIERIKEFLSNLVYPLYFFDYETFSHVVPAHNGVAPYQNVPFQYSLHVMNEPGGELLHKEFLHTTVSNPVPLLLKQLQDDIGKTGSVLVWYESFEKSRNTEMGELVPEYAQFMSELNDRIVDLMIPFANDWYSDKDFFGSASIKKVLPVLVPELSYKDLEIQEGNTASRTWKELVFDDKHSTNKDEIIAQLLEYCKLDTLAMVRLYEFLVNSLSA